MAEQEATGKGTASSSGGGSQRSTGPFSSFTNPFRKWSPSVDKQASQDEDNSTATAQSDVAKETTMSKDTTDTCSASPSMKRKETMAAVKTFLSMPLQKTATWIQSPFMSFPTKHRMKNEEIHRIFQELPEEEKLIDDYSCALQREILLQGRLYITQNWLCFYANIFTWVTLLTIPFKAIQSITKEKTVNLFPYAIQVCTSTDKYGFHSFMQRDSSFTILFRVWQNNLLSESMAMTPLELVKAARKAIGEDMPDDISPDDLWGPVKSSSSRDKSTVSSSPSSHSLPVDVASLGATTSTTTNATTSTSTTTTTSTSTTAAAASSGRSITRQFSMDFNLFRSFRSQKSHSSSESKASKLPGIKELEQTTTSTSESTTTETEDVPTVTMESAATQTSSTESSHKSDPDLVLAGNTPLADGDDLQERLSLKDEGRRHSDSSMLPVPPVAEANDVVSMESMKSSDVEFETGSLYDEIGEVLCGCEEHNGNLTLNEVFNCDVETLFQLLFTDHEFFKGFLKSRRTINLEFGEWVSQADGSKLRDIKYTLSLNYSFGPKFSPSAEHQIYSAKSQLGLKHIVSNEVRQDQFFGFRSLCHWLFYPREAKFKVAAWLLNIPGLGGWTPGGWGCYVRQEFSRDVRVVNGNIPYADSFYVCCRFCLTRVAHNKSRCRVTSNIAFRKSCWGLVKSLIERNAADGLRSYYSQLDTNLKEYLANLPAKKLHRKPHHRPRNRYRNTPPLTKKVLDHVSLSDAAMGTPKSNNSGLATPTSMLAVIGSNGSHADKTSTSGAVSMESVVQKLVKEKEQLPQENTRIPKSTIFFTIMLCCVLAVNMMVYMRLITSSQSGSNLQSSQHSDIKFEDLKLKEWPSSHKEWVELVKKQVESHDLEMESWLKSMRSIVDVLDQIQAMAAEIKSQIVKEMHERQEQSQSGGDSSHHNEL